MSLNKALLEKAYKLSAIQDELVPVKGGSLNDIWRFQTADGAYALKQILHIDAGNEKAMNLYRNTAAIAHLFLRMGLPCVPAKLTVERDVLYVDGEQVYMLFPWVEGEVIRADKLSVDRSVRIATCLAMMHAIKLNIPAAEAWQYRYDADAWQASLDQASDSIQSLLKSCLPDIEQCYSVYLDAMDSVMTDIVVSHRDLHAPNVLWTSATNFQIIDWDLAGKAPAAVELMYMLLDWSMEKRNLNMKKFTAMLCAYLSERPIETKATEALVNAVLLNWLSWVQHQIKKFSMHNMPMAVEVILVSELRHSLLSYQVIREETQNICDAWNAFIVLNSQ